MTEQTKFERTVRRLLATPPTKREDTQFGKLKAKPERSPKRKARAKR